MLDALSLNRERAGVAIAVLVVLIFAATGFVQFFWPAGTFPESWLAAMGALGSGGFVWLTGKQSSQPTIQATKEIAEDAAQKAADAVGPK